MQEKCYNIGSGEGVLQMQTLQRQAKNTGAWTHEDTEERERHQRKDDNFRWFSVNATLGKKSPYTAPYFPVYFPFFPSFLPVLGLERKYTGKYWRKKVGIGTAFSLCNGRKTKDRKRDNAVQTRVQARQKRRQFAAYPQTGEPK